MLCRNESLFSDNMVSWRLGQPLRNFVFSHSSSSISCGIHTECSKFSRMCQATLDLLLTKVWGFVYQAKPHWHTKYYSLRNFGKKPSFPASVRFILITLKWSAVDKDLQWESFAVFLELLEYSVRFCNTTSFSDWHSRFPRVTEFRSLRNFDFFRKSHFGKGEMKNQVQFRNPHQILCRRRSSSLKFEEKQILTSPAWEIFEKNENRNSGKLITLFHSAFDTESKYVEMTHWFVQKNSRKRLTVKRYRTFCYSWNSVTVYFWHADMKTRWN